LNYKQAQLKQQLAHHNQHNFKISAFNAYGQNDHFKLQYPNQINNHEQSMKQDLFRQDYLNAGHSPSSYNLISPIVSNSIINYCNHYETEIQKIAAEKSIFKPHPKFRIRV
jgi:hypothetical protein